MGAAAMGSDFIAMMASEDPSVYDFSEGWPETFGEYQET